MSIKRCDIMGICNHQVVAMLLMGWIVIGFVNILPRKYLYEFESQFKRFDICVRRIIDVTLLLLLILSICRPIDVMAGVYQTTFYVDSMIPTWQDTGLNIPTNCQIGITADGAVCHNSGSSCADANGWARPTDSSFLAPGLTQVSLVGKVGSSSPFFVGTSLNYTSSSSGKLYLGFNDNAFADNSYGFNVT